MIIPPQAIKESSGMVYVGLVHYNTIEEIKRFAEALGRITQAK
jgi:selenocysteine lyase/cysteine desulfurase